MPLIELPKDLRSELKEPLGPVYTGIDEAVEGRDGDRDPRFITVGDIVTYHFLVEGILPDVSVVDGMTERHEVDEEIVEKWLEIPNSLEVENPAGTVTRDLLNGLCEGLESDGAIRVDVDGEEDLATLPVIAKADIGDTVVYGQPGEGMVFVDVTEEKKDEAVSLMRRMDIEDTDEMESLLELA
ncbi:GTP-dependent dephospho-CoA kinase family protein [Halorutilales archaeon Cl-col2-1]